MNWNEVPWQLVTPYNKGGRSGAQFCSVSPHPFLSSAICQRPGRAGIPVGAEGGMEPTGSAGRTPASLGDSLN